ncbi:MAG: family transporter [Rhizobacter sp.]|nr:family transporter [Rhizobacter sp.]
MPDTSDGGALTVARAGTPATSTEDTDSTLDGANVDGSLVDDSLGEGSLIEGALSEGSFHDTQPVDPETTVEHSASVHLTARAEAAIATDAAPLETAARVAERQAAREPRSAGATRVPSHADDHAGPGDRARAVLAIRQSSAAQKGLLFIATLFLLHEGRPVLLPVVMAIALTFVLSSLVRRLRRLGVPEVAGAAIVVCSLLAILALVIAAFAAPAIDWWDRAPTTFRQLMESVDRVRSGIPGLEPPPPVPVVRRVARSNAAAAAAAASAASAAAPPDPIREQIASQGVTITRLVLGQFVSFAVSAAATVILLYFLLASEHWIVSRTVEAVPKRRNRALVLGGIRAAQHDIGLFLGTQSMINAGVGVATGAACVALGVPNPLLWGALAALLNYVPYLGPMLIGSILLLVGVMSFSMVSAMVLPAVAYLAIHLIEANFVTPWLIGHRLKLSPLAVFLSVMLWGWLWGIAGALLAVPILLGFRTFIKRTRRYKLLCAYLDGGYKAPPSLRSLMRVKLKRAESGLF